MFLSRDEVGTLTGYKHRAKQIAQLRLMGIAFHVNAAGDPIVAKATIEGRTPTKKTWEPSWAGSQPAT